MYRRYDARLAQSTRVTPPRPCRSMPCSYQTTFRPVRKNPVSPMASAVTAPATEASTRWFAAIPMGMNMPGNTRKSSVRRTTFPVATPHSDRGRPRFPMAASTAFNAGMIAKNTPRAAQHGLVSWLVRNRARARRGAGPRQEGFAFTRVPGEARGVLEGGRGFTEPADLVAQVPAHRREEPIPSERPRGDELVDDVEPRHGLVGHGDRDRAVQLHDG